ncbi:MAG: TPM domain-containing protein [Lachnospiraceae bacterium]|nr:TPM domain-containing protein [Lachnospiraceae bacterium]
MKKYFRQFRWVFLAVAVLAAVTAIVYALGLKSGEKTRTNSECTTEERVFDYADVLTDEEENNLRQLISKRETEAGCDIVLVTLEESLADYAAKYEKNCPTNQYVRIFADNFYDEHAFGFNKPRGDGIILVDNYFREADGKIHTWLSTCGSTYETYSDEMIDQLLDDVYEDVDTDPYRAYETYVNDVYYDMQPASLGAFLSIPVCLIAATVILVLYLLYQFSLRQNGASVMARTYMEGGKPEFHTNRDQYLRKFVTTRHIERNTGGSGGGGGHISSGGVSHGGGGHSR